MYIDRIKRYIVDEQICKMDVDFYIRQYPDRIYRSIHEMGLYEFLYSDKGLAKMSVL